MIIINLTILFDFLKIFYINMFDIDRKKLVDSIINFKIIKVLYKKNLYFLTFILYFELYYIYY